MAIAPLFRAGEQYTSIRTSLPMGKLYIQCVHPQLDPFLEALVTILNFIWTFSRRRSHSHSCSHSRSRSRSHTCSHCLVT